MQVSQHNAKKPQQYNFYHRNKLTNTKKKALLDGAKNEKCFSTCNNLSVGGISSSTNDP